MSKTEFLDRLRMALNGRVSPEVVQENLDYYTDYINSRIRMGSSEEEVMDSLGDPRLIAKTIIGTSNMDTTRVDDVYEENGRENREYEKEQKKYERAARRTQKLLRMPLWLWATILLVIGIVILVLVFTVLSFLLPILIPLALIAFAIKLIHELWIRRN